ncbi:MAG: TrkA C-terminal domain-containing protein [Candidatus Heimdallarchaeota archaeon]
MSKITYEPISAKDALKQIKDLCSIMVDLAYSSIIFEDKDLAEEVKELRDLVVHLDYLLIMSLEVAVRDGRDAQATLPLVVLGQASKDIANSATDIANVLIKGFVIHPTIKELSQKVARDLMRGEISEESILKGYTVAEVVEKMNYSIVIFAIRRSGKWLIIPEKDMALQAGDIILASGSSSGISLLKLLVGGSVEEISPPEEEDEDIDHQIITENIVDYLIALKDTSEVMVDLAYGAVLYNNKELAQLVSNMEKRVDTIRNKAEIAILKLAKSSSEDITSLQGLLRTIEATENISDSANQIAKIVLTEIPSHPIIELVIGESAESIFEKVVEESSPLVGKTVPAGNYLDEFGIRVLAIKRKGGHYFKPRRRTKIRAGDTIIFTGLRDACTAFQKREEEAVEEKEAKLEATKKAAEQVVDKVITEVVEAATDAVAKEVSKKAAVEIAPKVIERVSEKVTQKTITKAASEVTEKVTEEMVKKLAKEVAKETIESVEPEQLRANKKEVKKALEDAVEAAAKKSLAEAKKDVVQAAKESAEEKIEEKSATVYKKAEKAATEMAAKEVESIVKETIKVDAERAAKRAAAEAIKEVHVVESPEKIVKDASKDVAISAAEKAAEKVVERTGKRVAAKAAEEVASEVVENEITKVATKAAKEVVKEKVKEVIEKEVKEVAKKAAEEAAEKVSKTE